MNSQRWVNVAIFGVCVKEKERESGFYTYSIGVLLNLQSLYRKNFVSFAYFMRVHLAKATKNILQMHFTKFE